MSQAGLDIAENRGSCLRGCMFLSSIQNHGYLLDVRNSPQLIQRLCHMQRPWRNAFQVYLLACLLLKMEHLQLYLLLSTDSMNSICQIGGIGLGGERHIDGVV